MRLSARVDREETLRYLGYGGQALNSDLQTRLDHAIAACEHDLVPQGVYRCFQVGDAKTAGFEDEATNVYGSQQPLPSLALKGTALRLEGYDIARHLQGALRVVLMACTLGMESERQLRCRAALSPTDVLLYSAAASSLVERAADALCEIIADETQHLGLYAGLRYSPGYGDLPLDVQSAFVGALDATRLLGLSVTESNMLMPTKSITAVLGLFDRPPTSSYTDTVCAACKQKDSCVFRTEGTTCHDATTHANKFA